MAYGVSEGGKDETRIDDRSVETCILVCVVISRYVWRSIDGASRCHYSIAYMKVIRAYLFIFE